MKFEWSWLLTVKDCPAYWDFLFGAFWFELLVFAYLKYGIFKGWDSQLVYFDLLMMFVRIGYGVSKISEKKGRDVPSPKPSRAGAD